LRTGRIVPEPDDVERKFNPWHDPEDGRFTFSGQGRYFAGGDLPPHLTHAPPPSVELTDRHTAIYKNGYRYDIDNGATRTNEVRGELTLKPQPRSRSEQQNAGKPDGGIMTMAGILLPLASTFPASGAIISPRTRASIGGLTEFSKKDGLAMCEPAGKCSSTSFRTTTARQGDRLASKLSGTSTDSVPQRYSPTKAKANKVAGDKFDKLGPLLSSLGEKVAGILGGDPNGIYLYVEVGDRWMSVSVFRDEGNAVRNYPCESELTDLLWELWREESPDPEKRWAVMEYEIRAGKFDARFTYPDKVDVESYDLDRREIALKKRFGDKPVIYLNGALGLAL
jgi:hypothetical protein